jgi:Mg2+/citrate symporter
MEGEGKKGFRLEKTEFNPILTFIILSIIAFFLTFWIYMLINGILFEELIERWSEIIDNLFTTESIFFLIFFGIVFALGLFVYFWNEFIMWTNCKTQKKVFNKKTRMCE